jgi:hypothetical protein
MPPCVSIYLPTHPASPEGQQDSIRLKNLLNRAETELTAGWMRAVEARKLLERARTLCDDSAFWSARSQGLAIFIAPDVFECFRLPETFDDAFFVEERFYLRPLLSLLNDDTRFHILALSQNKVQLYEADRCQIQSVELPGLQASMKESLNQVSVDRGAQVHSATGQPRGKQSVVFHGQGGKAESRKEDLQQYFRMVDKIIAPLVDKDPRPLLLAGVEYETAIFRKVSNHPNLADESLDGNWDYRTPYELHQRAWQSMEHLLAFARQTRATNLQKVLGTDRACDDIKSLLPAAASGRVESLFLDASAHKWGLYDDVSGLVECHQSHKPGDIDLLDAVAIETLRHRGTVYAVDHSEMPSSAPVAALLRY